MESGYHRKSTWQEPRADANVTTVSFLPGTSAMRRTQDLQWETVVRETQRKFQHHRFSLA